MKKLILSLFLIPLFLACTDAESAKIGSYNTPHKVELMNCDGTVAREWISTGKVLTEQHSDGYYFFDSKTELLIEVSGNVVITRLDKMPPTVTITP